MVVSTNKGYSATSSRSDTNNARLSLYISICWDSQRAIGNKSEQKNKIWLNFQAVYQLAISAKQTTPKLSNLKQQPFI